MARDSIWATFNIGDGNNNRTNLLEHQVKRIPLKLVLKVKLECVHGFEFA